MNYVGKMWRPPSEAKSLILQTTVGCSHNNCTFCIMYKEKDFYIKSMEEIKQEIEEASQAYPGMRRVFLADGDALKIPTEDLLTIMGWLDEAFPRLTRVTTYASPQSIQEKTVEELRELNQAGLKMAYLGLESGSAKFLKEFDKWVTLEMMVDAGQKLKKAGIKASVTMILGLGGEKLSDEHARETAKVVNRMEPRFLSALTLMVDERAPLYQRIDQGEFRLLNPYQAIQELYTLIKHIDVEEPCIFRSNHASNYIAANGTLPKDKEDMLSDLKDVLDNPEKYHLKQEYLRSL